MAEVILFKWSLSSTGWCTVINDCIAGNSISVSKDEYDAEKPVLLDFVAEEQALLIAVLPIRLAVKDKHTIVKMHKK